MRGCIRIDNSTILNLLIISSTFPTSDADPVGGFVLDFCLKLSENHKVTVLTQKRAEAYSVDKRINLVTFPWSGDRRPLSDLKFYNPFHLLHIMSLFRNARKALNKIAADEKIDHCFALWGIPSGIAARYLFRRNNIPYDIWCLGSDIWKHKENPFTSSLLHKILTDAKQVYGDGFKFCKEIEAFSDRDCKFLPSSRVIPKTIVTEDTESRKIFVFIGRYHINKGPDVLMRAIAKLPEEVMQGSVFRFYGLGSMKKQMEDMLVEAKLTNVEIHGVVDKNDIYGVISSAHFIIIPSRIDSIPVILSDSLQCGTPIIGADVGDLGDVIKKFKIGSTFTRENSDELCGRIVETFHEVKEDYGENIVEALKIFLVDNDVKEFNNNLKQ
jgi:glycosyltransferase involved in cell wall biosynthesis